MRVPSSVCRKCACIFECCSSSARPVYLLDATYPAAGAFENPPACNDELMTRLIVEVYLCALSTLDAFSIDLGFSVVGSQAPRERLSLGRWTRRINAPQRLDELPIKRLSLAGPDPIPAFTSRPAVKMCPLHGSFPQNSPNGWAVPYHRHRWDCPHVQHGNDLIGAGGGGGLCLGAVGLGLAGHAVRGGSRALLSAGAAAGG